MQRETVITGRVIRGIGYGHRLGFPTVNLDRRGYSRRKRKIRLGIYFGAAGIVESGKSNARRCPYPAAIVIGPKDSKGLPKIEAHLLDFSGVLYGKRLTLTLERYIRPFVSFTSERKLRAQIRQDLRAMRKSISKSDFKESPRSDLRSF